MKKDTLFGGLLIRIYELKKNLLSCLKLKNTWNEKIKNFLLLIVSSIFELRENKNDIFYDFICLIFFYK